MRLNGKHDISSRRKLLKNPKIYAPKVKKLPQGNRGLDLRFGNEIFRQRRSNSEFPIYKWKLEFRINIFQCRKKGHFKLWNLPCTHFL